MKLFETYKKLNTGIKRLLIVGYAIWWISIFYGIGDIIEDITDRNDLATFLIAIFGYWLIVIIALWTFAGFKEKRN